MIGMPVDFTYQIGEHLEAVKKHLMSEAFCPEEIAEGIIARLAVTSRGLDINPSRPNIVLLSIGSSGQPAELTAQVLAQALFGDRNRLIDIDMTRFMHETDLHWLLGAPPGYIGHDHTPEFLLQISEQPWSVVLLRDINLSHPKAQEVFAQAIRSGYITSFQDKKVYLSDAVFVLTMDLEQKEGKQLGFLPHEKSSAGEDERPILNLNHHLIEDMIKELDFSWTPEQLTLEKIEVWVKEWVFPPVYERYSQMGLEMEIKSDLVHWLASEIMRINNLNHGEQLLEEEVLPNLIPYLNTKGKIFIDLTEDNLIQIIKDQGGKHAV
jgi:ATP-dependent Clp protease ATP-binding subunit ClpC